MNFDSLIDVYLQPIFDRNGNIKYAEALLRPVRYGDTTENILKRIKNMKKNIDMDLYILNRVCNIINRYNIDIIICVNICKGTLKHKRVSDMIINIINGNNVPRDRIVIELNEYTNFRDKDIILGISKLAGAGIGIAIDDFGIGNANITALSGNINIIKFDKDFLLTEDADIPRLKSLIFNLGKIGIDTVIEGVETEEQLNHSRMVGYNNIQGYYLCKPISIDAFKKIY